MILDWLRWWIGFVIPLLCLGECSSGICDEASCINGGTCTAVRADSYICLCPLGFKGRHCEDGEKEASWWRFLSKYSFTLMKVFISVHLAKPHAFLWDNIALLGGMRESSFTKLEHLWVSTCQTSQRYVHFKMLPGQALVGFSWLLNNFKKPRFVWSVIRQNSKHPLLMLLRLSDSLREKVGKICITSVMGQKWSSHFSILII